MDMLGAPLQLAGPLIDGLRSGTGFPAAHAAAEISDLLFFREINSFLTGEIEVFRDNLLGRTASLLGGAALALLTLWILSQGYRIAIGPSRESIALDHDP